MKIGWMLLMASVAAVGRAQMTVPCDRATTSTPACPPNQTCRCDYSESDAARVKLQDDAAKAVVTFIPVPITQGTLKTSEPLTITNTAYFAVAGDSPMAVIMTCDSDGDWSHVKNCKLAEGHTLDEAMNQILQQMQEQQKAQQERYDKLMEWAERYVASVKKGLAAIQAALHPKPAASLKQEPR